MKTDRFMQGILVSDDDELFTYHYHKPDRKFHHVVTRLKLLKKNLTSFKYITQANRTNSHNKQAVFSKTAVDGNVEQAITDVWDRLHIKHEDSKDV